ncbi:UDP-N-acetylmuramoyl-L-alanine--D-glutamate ligase [Ideonella sp. B7]|uniref:UDP-N-acetylmuramoyl-L-alanine--D-glutamate ligase n=1 Tax=Ideonella benzenivorans TaxID=2831643 RepID=UPI001CEC12D7|nr:UDP-N-acetylmuramoyl-L-alanine--D-glutamate ligase [Ideonella benzenivorans]MCA6217001.1 UDP-N-acetylmuramoyl-L-alanine--D-glutamate ligase [Ideonella benzenivorans]
MKHLQDLSVLILGLGDSGLAMARWCARHGATRIRVWDSRANPPQAVALAADVPAAAFFSGPLTAETLGDARLLLKSPGLSPLKPELQPLLRAAQAVGVPLNGELDLFAHALADLQADWGYAPKVLAITGTNGKTTTTSLTAQLVERCGRRVAVAGNIGPTLLDTLTAVWLAETEARALAAEQAEAEAAQADVAAQAPVAEAPDAQLPAETESDTEGDAADGPDAADEEGADAAPVDDEAPTVVLAPPPAAEPVFEHLPQAWVLELSSFQLDGVQGFEPSAATVLNVTQDHLDWHGSMEAYAAAKARIFGQQAVMVINRDDPLVEAMEPAPVMVSPGRGRPKKAVSRRVCRFGLNPPQHPGDFGLVVEGGMAWLVRAMPADETIKRRKDEPEEIILQRLMPADALRIRGRHNAANALAALALATAIDCPLAPMLHGLREYRGEPHRVESVGIVGGIEAFDDSKGTNVGATVAALDGLGADRHGKLVVILGGLGKGQDFAPLAEPVARHVRAVATLGRDAEAIEAMLAGTGVPFQRHATLEAAVPWCFAQARSGDAVLLSPACASMDMFRDYAHRSQVFIAAVQQWAADHGEVLA